MIHMVDIMREVMMERCRQEEKWGQQNHHAGTGGATLSSIANTLRDRSEQAVASGRLTWKHILEEEVAEAFACDPRSPELREELIQVAAVAVAWVESIERRMEDANQLVLEEVEQ